MSGGVRKNGEAEARWSRCLGAAEEDVYFLRHRHRVIALSAAGAYVDVADDDRVAVGVQKVLSFGVPAQHDRLATGRARQCRVDELCGREGEVLFS